MEFIPLFFLVRRPRALTFNLIRLVHVMDAELSAIRVPAPQLVPSMGTEPFQCPNPA